MIVSVLAEVPDGANETLQSAVVELTAPRLHGAPVKDPLPSLVKSTVPAGVLGVPGEVSFTEAVQVEDWPIWTEAGLQTIIVEVVRLLTARLELPELAECVESPE